MRRQKRSWSYGCLSSHNSVLCFTHVRLLATHVYVQVRILTDAFGQSHADLCFITTLLQNDSVRSLWAHA